MPAEWEPHQATWIAWPHQRDDWPGKFAPIPWIFVEIVRHLHLSERVGVLVHDDQTKRQAKRTLTRAGVDLGELEQVVADGAEERLLRLLGLREARATLVREGGERSTQGTFFPPGTRAPTRDAIGASPGARDDGDGAHTDKIAG